MSFILFLVSFQEKGTKIVKYGIFGGFTQRRSDPTQRRRSTQWRSPRCGEGFPHRSVVDNEEWPDLRFAAT